MKKIIYISIFIIGLSFLFSFRLEQNNKKFSNENWWVFKKNSEGDFKNKKKFFGKKTAYKFYEDHTLIALVNHGFCRNGGFYTKMQGDWNFLNDSTLELYYGRTSINTYFTKTVNIKWKNDKTIKLETLSSDVSVYPRKLRPMSL